MDSVTEILRASRNLCSALPSPTKTSVLALSMFHSRREALPGAKTGKEGEGPDAEMWVIAHPIIFRSN